MSNPGDSDNFGDNVVLDEDGDTLVVAAGDEDSNATGVDGDGSDNSAGDSGAVYVFAKSGESWVQQAFVKASNTDGRTTLFQPQAQFTFTDSYNPLGIFISSFSRTSTRRRPTTSGSLLSAFSM